MKLEGKFLVVLSDGLDQYHSNGGWTIQRGPKEVATSIDHEVWVKDPLPLRMRLSDVARGDRLSATSHTGKTGVEGTIVSRTMNYLLVEGQAWGPSHSAYAPNGRCGFRTFTFDVIGVDAVYSGSLESLKGSPADHGLIRRIEVVMEKIGAWAEVTA